MEKEILICCINYNNSEEVLKYALDISKQQDSGKVKLVITDNSTIEQEKINLQKKIGNIDLDITILNPEANLGYLNGMFLGVKQYYDLYKEYPKWTIFSNTDIEFESQKFIKELIDKKYDDNYFCIAPSVYSPETNSYQNPHYKTRITLKNIDRVLFFTKYYFLFNIYCLLSSIKSNKLKKQREKSQEVYAAHGCFFILKKDYFEKLLELKYGSFLYSEEAFIAETIREKKKKIYYDSDLKIIHKEHSTTSLLGNKKRAKLINESLKYIKNRFYLGEENGK